MLHIFWKTNSKKIRNNPCSIPFTPKFPLHNSSLVFVRRNLTKRLCHRNTRQFFCCHFIALRSAWGAELWGNCYGLGRECSWCMWLMGVGVHGLEHVSRGVVSLGQIFILVECDRTKVRCEKNSLCCTSSHGNEKYPRIRGWEKCRSFPIDLSISTRNHLMPSLSYAFVTLINENT